MWRYVRPYRREIVVMAVAAAAGIGAGIVVPLVVEGVVNGPIAHHRPAGMVTLGLLALAFGLAEAGGAMLRRWLQSMGLLHMEADLRNDLYAHLQALPVSFHDRWQSGQLLSRAMTDISTVRRFFSFGAIFLVINSATYVVVVLLLLHLDLPLGALVAVSAVPVVALSAAFEHRYRSISRRVQDLQGDLTTVIEESALGIRVLKAFGRRREALERLRSEATAFYDSSMQRVRLEAFFWPTLQLVPNLTLAVVLVVGGVQVARGGVSLGALVAFMSLLLLLAWPVESLGFILASAQEAMTAADRIFEVLDTVPELADPRHPLHLPVATGAIAFDGVSFTYPGTSEPVLRDIWLEVEPGETLMVVGATGSGKTTLVSLVPRLYDPTAGRITLDGIDIARLPLAELRRHVGVAFEDPILFSASVRENVLLGAPDATEHDLLEALEVAQADFVFDLPWGLETRIGEQGLALSGGQRQRLALARAIVGHPAALVLDDPLSALDVHTEAIVERALARVLARTTALVVAHRPSTLALADRVALLAHGRLVAVGTHAELMATEPLYRAVLSADAESDDRPLHRDPGRPAEVAAGRDRVADRPGVASQSGPGGAASPARAGEQGGGR